MGLTLNDTTDLQKAVDVAEKVRQLADRGDLAGRLNNATRKNLLRAATSLKTATEKALKGLMNGKDN